MALLALAPWNFFFLSSLTDLELMAAVALHDLHTGCCLLDLIGGMWFSQLREVDTSLACTLSVLPGSNVLFFLFWPSCQFLLSSFTAITYPSLFLLLYYCHFSSFMTPYLLLIICLLLFFIFSPIHCLFIVLVSFFYPNSHPLPSSSTLLNRLEVTLW